MNLLETARLALRHLDLHDAEFIVELLNQETFLRHIGDKGVRSAADACAYLQQGPMDSYRRNGFGLYLTSLRGSEVPIGICGLVKRSALPDPDIGFALLPRYCAKGYASEAAAAVLDHGRQVLGLTRIVAIVSPGNHASAAVLEKIGLRYERRIFLEGEGRELKLFGPPATVAG